MAKWRRGGGRRRRWVFEVVPQSYEGRGARGEEEAPAEPDPFEHDDPLQIRAALARFEQRKMIEEKSVIVDG